MKIDCKETLAEDFRERFQDFNNELSDSLNGLKAIQKRTVKIPSAK